MTTDRFSQAFRRQAAPGWLRRLQRVARGQAALQVVLVLATMVACTWLAVPDFSADGAEVQAMAASGAPGEPR